MSDVEKICESIRQAFRGVVLGSGVGLHEGQAIDDYEDDAIRRLYREQDELEDWSAIPPSALDRCYSSLSFFDAEGMRFHLPAYLIAHLNEELRTADPVFYLWHEAGASSYFNERFSLLTREQRLAVREFLLYVRSCSSRYEFDRDDIDRALANYWTVD